MKRKIKCIILLLIVPIFLCGWLNNRFGPWWGIREQANTPETPSSGYKIWCDTSNDIFVMNDSGTNYQLNTYDPNNGLTDPTSIGTLTLGSGSITDSSGDISIGDENLTTTGYLYSEYIYHSSADADTGIRLRTDRMSCYAGARTMIDAVEGADDYLNLGYEGSTDIDVMIGANACLQTEGSSSDVIIYKSGTATAGTQYDSYDFDIRSSVWDTNNVQAEDRNMTLRTTGGSGQDGSEPYYLAIVDNDGNEVVQVDPVNGRVAITDDLSHLGDTDTRIIFATDDIQINAGGVCELEVYENASQSYFQYTTSAGVLRHKVWRVSLDDDDTDSLDVTITNSCMGWIIADNSGVIAEYATFVLGGDGNVTLLNNSANVVANAATDGNLCIGTAASQEPLTIQNRLGGTRSVLVEIKYY